MCRGDGVESVCSDDGVIYSINLKLSAVKKAILSELN